MSPYPTIYSHHKTFLRAATGTYGPVQWVPVGTPSRILSAHVPDKRYVDGRDSNMHLKIWRDMWISHQITRSRYMWPSTQNLDVQWMNEWWVHPSVMIMMEMVVCRLKRESDRKRWNLKDQRAATGPKALKLNMLHSRLQYTAGMRI